MNLIAFGRWHVRSLSIVAALFTAMSPAAHGDEQVPEKVAPLLADVVAAFKNIASTSEAANFTLGQTELPRGGHLQGIQVRFDASKNRHLVYLTHDSETVAYLLIVEFVPDLSRPGRVVAYQEFPSDGRSPPLRHAGGTQLVCDILAVGLEDNQAKTRSEVQFWDVSNADKPEQLKHLTIARSGAAKDKTSGAVGLLRRESSHLLAVANWDSRAIDFYEAAGARLSDPACRFKQLARWQVGSADTTGWQPDSTFETYQAINLVADEQGGLFLLGLNTTSAGQNIVDLFSMRPDQSPGKMLQKLDQKKMTLPRGNRFRFAGGIWVDRGRLAILSSQSNLAPETWIGIAR